MSFRHRKMSNSKQTYLLSLPTLVDPCQDVIAVSEKKINVTSNYLPHKLRMLRVNIFIEFLWLLLCFL